MQQPRRQRLAFLLLDGLDHFAHDLVNSLPQLIDWDVQAFRIAGSADFAAALAWADQPGRDALWFEFCGRPFRNLSMTPTSPAGASSCACTVSSHGKLTTSPGRRGTR